MFNTDKPISNSDEDLLNRKGCYSALAQGIISYIEEDVIDSITMGLYGMWGSGKTSILNLTLNEINNYYKDNPNAPIVLRFNPWNYSDQQKIILQFFNELSQILKRKDYGKMANAAGEKIIKYSKFFRPLKLIPGAGEYVNYASDIIEKSGESLKNLGELLQEDLASIKEDLNKDLGELNKKIIVVIDDIDRLTSEEITQVFQLVKQLGDFKNVIYILLFDREVVVKALNDVQKGDGNNYLEKIVQVPFELPPIPDYEIESYLLEKLSSAIKDYPQEKLDSEYWNKVYHNGFKKLFKSIRDINRFLNTFKFNYLFVKDLTNIIDLIFISAVKVFIPELYYDIMNNKKLFTEVSTSSRYAAKTGWGDENSEKRFEDYQKLLQKLPEVHKDYIDELLVTVFPTLKSSYDPEWLSIWRRENRLCSPDVFDNYFHLLLPKEEIPNKEIEEIINEANDIKIFQERLKILIENGSILRFLDRFQDYTNIIPEKHINNIVKTLMNVGDTFPNKESGFLGIDTPMRLLQIFYQLSFRYTTHPERFKLFKDAIQYTNESIYTIVNEVAVQDQQHARYGYAEKTLPLNELTVNSDQLDILEELALKKIRFWAKKGKLKDHANLISILFRWREWSKNNNEVIKYVKSITKNTKQIIHFISKSMWYSTIYSDTVKKVPNISIENLSNFIDIDRTHKSVKKFMTSNKVATLNEEEKTAANLFLSQLNESNEATR